MFKVSLEDYEDLSNEEKESASNNGCGKELATYIRVEHDGKTIFLESDAIEPEDKTFYRSLSWVSGWIAKAYNLGKKDGLMK